jgi:hypothetical protein
MELDFYCRQSWIDPRWIMAPAFWAGVDSRLANTGMEIYPLYAGEHREDPMPVWVPGERSEARWWWWTALWVIIIVSSALSAELV